MRKMSVVTVAGTENAYSWVMLPDNSADQQIPDGIQIGANALHLRDGGSGGNLAIMDARAAAVSSPSRLAVMRLASSPSVPPARLPSPCPPAR